MKSKNGILSLCHKKGGGHTLSAEKNNNSHFMETSKWGGGEQCTTCNITCIVHTKSIMWCDRLRTGGLYYIQRDSLSLSENSTKKKDSTLR